MTSRIDYAVFQTGRGVWWYADAEDSNRDLTGPFRTKRDAMGAMRLDAAGEGKRTQPSEGTDIMTSRERNCILAALRFWQWQRHNLTITGRTADICRIESNDDMEDILSDDEIDALCEEINV